MIKHIYLVLLYIMADELPTVVAVGQRRYRKYPIKNLQNAPVTFKSNKLNLLEEDDGESEDEEVVNIVVGDFEGFTNMSIKVTQEESITETIYYNTSTASYSLKCKLPQSSFYALCGGCSADSTPLQREIENNTRASIKGNPRDQNIEIKGRNYENIVKAHKTILDHFSISPKPNEYQVMTDKIIAIIKSDDPVAIDLDEVQTDEPKLEEYPQLDIKYDKKWQGYITKILSFPKECSDFLLSEKGKNIKILKREMKGNVEFNVNKQEEALEIVGYVEEQVKDGYAAFIRLLKNFPAADALIALQNPPPSVGRERPRNERKFTHFVSISFENNPDLIQAQREIHAEVPNLVPFMVNPSNRFHITIAVLSLSNVMATVEALNEVAIEIQALALGKPLNLTFDRVGYFGKVQAANVLFLDLLHDKEFSRLTEISNRIHMALMKKGVLTQNDLKKQKTEQKGNTFKKIFHMTLAKSKGSSNTLDLTRVMNGGKKINIKVIGMHVELLSMQTDTSTSSYPKIHTISII